MEKVTAAAFIQAWLDTVNLRRDYLLNIWRYPAQFTSYIKGKDNSIIEEVANKLNLIAYATDYYSIDTILYKKKDLVPGLNEGQFWFRDIRVAFEHENTFNEKLREETAHLLITNCDLRVLVSYPQNDEKEIRILNYLHEIIKGNRNSKAISKEESFLLIFGYENGFEWNGYVYKEDMWKNLEGHNQE